MSKTSVYAILFSLLLAGAGSACRRSETPATPTRAAREEAEEREKRREAAARSPARGEMREEEDEEGDSEEAKEAAQEARMRQRALEQLKEYRAANCLEAIAKVRGLLVSKKDRWTERNERGQMPADLVQTLTQAELWEAQSEPLCKGDPARSHLDDLRNLIAAIWQYPRAVPRDVLEKRLEVLG